MGRGQKRTHQEEIHGASQGGVEQGERDKGGTAESRVNGKGTVTCLSPLTSTR